MSIELELQQELEAAMRSRDKPRLDVIRQVRTEVSIKVAEPGFAGSIDDDLYRAVIGSYVKKMAKAKEEYDSLGERGAPMAAKLEFEISYLGRWLPRLLSEEETRSLVRQA
ncbi:MAG TPA: GatB/YqeY domain-containing protein, partial [Acidimicrobiia bacterium]